MPNAQPRSGLLVIDKPAGITSRDVVNRVNRIQGRGTSAGHAGTLDPLATGVLIVCLGEATRLVEYIQRQQKAYRAAIRLGADSSTDDAEGSITERPHTPPPAIAQIEAALRAQTGTVMQVPPRFSAVHVAGKRAHKLARAGQEISLAPRPVQIDSITTLDYHWPELLIDVVCGSGTYIRSIARDLGAALGCGGLLTSLKRTRIGRFTLENALNFESLDQAAIGVNLHPPTAAVADLPVLSVDENACAAVRHGRAIAAPSGFVNPAAAANEIALIDANGHLLAIGEVDATTGRIQPRKVFSATA